MPCVDSYLFPFAICLTTLYPGYRVGHALKTICLEFSTLLRNVEFFCWVCHVRSFPLREYKVYRYSFNRCGSGNAAHIDRRDQVISHNLLDEKCHGKWICVVFVAKGGEYRNLIYIAYLYPVWTRKQHVYVAHRRAYRLCFLNGHSVVRRYRVAHVGSKPLVPKIIWEVPEIWARVITQTYSKLHDNFALNSNVSAPVHIRSDSQQCSLWRTLYIPLSLWQRVYG